MSTLVIPIDVSQVAEKDRGQQKVKIAVQTGDKITSQVVAVETGKAEVKLEVDAKQTLSLAVGPEGIPDDEIFHFQTLTVSVSPRQWVDKVLKLSPIVVTPTWWVAWLGWCRTFVITGRVVCANGNPAPGAEVRAFDVDYFWWWSSVAQVGPAAITDASGHFAIKFRWCCGWWPWWWWKVRSWSLDPVLIDRIYPVLKLNPNLQFREPDPVPSVDIVTMNPHTLPPSPAVPASLGITKPIDDPSVIPGLRDRLITVLPRVPDFERLRIWPWWPWTPWLDCSPDIIFRVTQNCAGQNKVIVNENVFQARWDIPTSLNVTLIANSDACCLPPVPPEPVGDCAVFTDVCGILMPQIGGNAGAPAPVGYVNPGGRDRPFSEVINLTAQFGSAAQADFYEIESSPHLLGTWTSVPSSALQGFSRGYFDATAPWPNQWFSAGFPLIPMGVKQVYESRHHYEATHPPLNWDSAFGRIWISNRDLVASIQTANVFADGVYDFRIVGYKADASGNPDPTTRKVMDGCGGQPNNLAALRLDNRIASGPPAGSVHVTTTEPDCGINAVRIGGVGVAPCGAQQLHANTPLEIDFFATDPDGHLDHYELVVKYDLGSIKNLLNAADVGAFTLTPLVGGPQGPDYANAVTPPQHPLVPTARPVWNGGTMRLHVNDASKVFPKTCCYLIELTVYKRNIVNCNGNLTYYNQMHYSFTVTV